MAHTTVTATWLGHGTFVFQYPGGKRLIVDPWLTGNPACPPQAADPGPLDAILVTHGHSDHIEDAARLSREKNAAVVGAYELCGWLERRHGVTRTIGMNKGGTTQVAGVLVTMVDARHSSSVLDNGTLVYLGDAAGFVLRAPGTPTIYFAGDTAVFGDMALIAELYQPVVAMLPIGDVFTMDPKGAAKAASLLRVRTVVPMHYGTYPALSGRPEELRALVAGQGVSVVDVEPGESIGLA